MRELAIQALAIVHVLAGAAWFGAMAYSLFVLQPKAARYFDDPAKFEEFIASIAQGARWPVVISLSVIAATGAGLWLVATNRGTAWTVLIAVKLALFLIALAIFCYTSWRLWPARVFAMPQQVARFQRTFRRVGWTLISIAAMEIALGVLARGW
jgi:uncharacterized membrane protein